MAGRSCLGDHARAGTETVSRAEIAPGSPLNAPRFGRAGRVAVGPIYGTTDRMSPNVAHALPA